MSVNQQKEPKNYDVNSSALLNRISKAIAIINDGFELLKVIVSETQMMFGFYEIGLFVLSKDKTTVTDYGLFSYEESWNQQQKARLN
jgi:translation elongation factor EF-1beta